MNSNFSHVQYTLENSNFDFSKYLLIRNRFGTHWVQRIGRIHDGNNEMCFGCVKETSP